MIEGKRQYWLDGFEGVCEGGLYFRSKIAIEISDFEERTERKVVAITVEQEMVSDKPSWNVEFLLEASPKDVLKSKNDITITALKKETTTSD